MKNIERGCIAIIVNSYCGNNGLRVTVGNFIGKSPQLILGNVWEIDRLIPSTNGWVSMEIPEHNLRRIDYDGDEKISWEELKQIWQPNKTEELA